jgi:hypothetical protein
MIPIEIIAAEIVEDLQAALAQFAEIVSDLKRGWLSILFLNASVSNRSKLV